MKVRGDAWIWLCGRTRICRRARRESAKGTAVGGVNQIFPGNNGAFVQNCFNGRIDHRTVEKILISDIRAATVTNSVSGVRESRFVLPAGGFVTAPIGGFVPTGMLPACASAKFPGEATPPGVP